MEGEIQSQRKVDETTEAWLYHLKVLVLYIVLSTGHCNIEQSMSKPRPEYVLDNRVTYTFRPFALLLVENRLPYRPLQAHTRYQDEF